MDKTGINRFGFVLAALLCLSGTSAAAGGTLVVTNGADDGAGSLRATVAAALSGDTVRFAPGVTEVVLTTGQITLDKSLTVNGAFVTVRRESAAFFRIFEVTGGAEVKINGLTMSGGRPVDGGGGILNRAGSTLTLTGCTVSNNAVHISAIQTGGGIYNSGTLTVSGSTISGNSVSDSSGDGGGIYNPGVATVIGSTIAGNTSDAGGGIHNFGTLYLQSSILADNDARSDIFRSVDGGDYFLIENWSDLQAHLGPAVGTHYKLNVDPMLGPLQDNGGPTPTYALGDGSPAIDAGAEFGQTTDQRGAPRVVGPAADIGAFESGAKVFTVNTTADDEPDGACTALAAGGDCTLREAIMAANAAATDDVILFNIPSGDPGYEAAGDRFTIALLSGIPGGLVGKLAIVGPGANRLTVKRGAQLFSPIFFVGAQAMVAIRDLTVSGGNVSEFDGGIRNEGVLEISGVTVSQHTAVLFGGLSNFGGVMKVIASTVSGNSAKAAGIQNSGTLLIEDSTVSGNEGSETGGIDNLGTLTITSSTVSGNSGGGWGAGGIWNESVPGFIQGTLNLNSSIVSGNVGQPEMGGGHDILGAVNSGDFNLVQSSVGLTGTLPGSHNLTGVDPLLGPLADNGGPTFTRALLFGSPALDSGSSGDLSTDQRGLQRTVDLVEVDNASDGDGTDIGAFEAQTAPVSSTPSVDAGGPYSVAEGGSSPVSATGADPEGGALNYEWDLDGDGVFEAEGQDATFSTELLDGPDNRTIRVRVTDTQGLTDIAEATVNVDNVAPSVGTPQVSPAPGGVVSVSAGFSDPAPDDEPFTCAVNFGDGSDEVQGTVSGNTCSAGHVYSAEGSYTVTVKVTDKDGDPGSNSADYQQTALNTAPSVETEGPYSVEEGGSINVSAAGTDPEGDELTYEWDLDDDGEFESQGQQVTFFALTLDGPDSRTIRVRATDTGGLSGVDATTVIVENVAPSVSPPEVSPTRSAPGEFVAVNAVVTEPGPSGDGLTCTFNFGDGSGDFPAGVSGNVCIGPPHIYSTAGSFTVTVTVTDKDGASDSNSVVHTVIAPYNFTGFFSPVLNPPSVNTVKAGAKVSITFGLGGNQGLNIFAPDSPASQRIDINTKDPIGDAALTKPLPPSGLTYNKRTNRYTYAWQTDRTWVNTSRQFILTLSDGSVHKAYFTFKK